MSYIAFQSTYSLLQSTITIDRMLAYAKEHDIKHVLLADRNVLFGAVEFYQKAQANECVPHIGMRVDVAHIGALVIAKNNQGLKSLQTISSLINSFGFEFTNIETLFHAIEDAIIVLDKTDAELLALLRNKPRTDVFIQAQAENKGDAATVLLPLCNGLDEADGQTLTALRAIDENVEQTKLATLPTVVLPRAVDVVLPDSFFAAIVSYSFDTYELPTYASDGADNEALFVQLCQKGLKKRYGTTLTQTHVERLQYEIQIIKQMGFIDYFLIIWDVMRFARKADIIIGPGRGSSVGSIVAYVLGITKLDPLAYGLLFERFLNSERQTMPDIDIDVEDGRRNEIIAYLREKYGYHHVAHILTFGTFGAKSAIRDMSKALGHNQDEVNAVLKHMTHSFNTIAEHVADSPALQKIIKTHESIKELIRAAQTIEGFPRHSSIHAAGVILTDKPIETFIATIEPESQMLVSQATMSYCEQIGLLKIDFLGLRNLTIIRQVAEQVMDGPSVIDFIEQKIPCEDEATFKMLSTGDTTGIFQLESPGMRQVLQKFKIQQFIDIAVVLSLYRPGPMQFIDEYIARKEGRNTYELPFDAVAPILQETHGIMVYQEQVMQIAQIVGGMSLAEADNFRRAMSKKNATLLQKQRTTFIAGAKEKGFDEEAVSTLFDDIMAFASYGFNKSHAIAYALIAYQMAYLKVHYPAVFMSGLLNSVIQNEKKALQYLQEATRFGIKILPADINKSGPAYVVENKNIRIGLGAIKSVGKITIEHIMALRTEQPFVNLADFLTRTEGKIVNVAVLDQLTNGYAFSTFSKNQKAIHMYLKNYDKARNIHGQTIPIAQNIDANEPDYTLVERRELEQKAYGFTIFAHPLLHYPRNQYSLSRPPKNYLSYIVYVERIHEITTKKGAKMAFATMSDMQEATEVVIFPYAYEKYSLFLREKSVVRITVQVPKGGTNKNEKLSVSKVEPMPASS